MASRAIPVTGVLLTLWRAAAGFRVVALAFCLYLIIRWHDLYAAPVVAFGVGIAMAIVTVVVVVLAVPGRAHRLGFVTADVAICIALTLLTRLAQHPRQFHGDMPTLTSVWAAGPAIEVGLLLGGVAGGLAGLLQLAASVVVREGYDGRTLANGLLLIIVGGIAGYLATVTVRVEQDRAHAAAERARIAERDRLIRSIHDGVLQTLGLVHRRGAAAGGEWAELGREAAEQAATLRALITSQAIVPAPAGLRNLTADLATLRSAQVTVSLTEAPIQLPSHEAGEVFDAVRAALHNVEQHAGSGARTWVLLEDLGGEVAVTVRDDGVGISAGRLDEAVTEGRLGVATSIRGRIADLGGRVRISSAPGEGTEVEIVVPHHSAGKSES
jgi:signal transduction histidine kinase